MEPLGPKKEAKNARLDRIRNKIDSGHRRGKQGKWLKPEQTGKKTKNQYDDELKKTQEEILINSQPASAPEPAPAPKSWHEWLKATISPTRIRAARKAREDARQWQEAENRRLARLGELNDRQNQLRDELKEIERLKQEETDTRAARPTRPPSPAKKPDEKEKARRAAEEEKDRELIGYIEDRLPEDPVERAEKTRIALEAHRLGADQHRIRIHLPLVRSTDDMMLHYLLREKLPLGIKWVIPNEGMQKEIEKFGKPTVGQLAQIENRIRQKYSKKGDKFQKVHDVVKAVADQYQQKILDHAQGMIPAEQIQSMRAWAPVYASDLGKLAAAWDLRNGFRMYEKWKTHSAGKMAWTQLYRMRGEIYGFLDENREELENVYADITKESKNQDRSIVDYLHGFLSPGKAKTKDGPSRPSSQKHPRYPWDLRPVPQDFEQLLEGNVRQFLEMVNDVNESVNNVKGRVQPQTENVAAGRHTLAREFIDLHQLKTALNDEQKVELLAPLFRWTRQTGGVRFPLGPEATLSVDVNRHLFKSVQTHPELRNEQFVREMFLTLCGFPSDAVEHVIDGGRDRHIVLQRKITPIQYHPQAPTEKQEFIHVRVLGEDEKGMKATVPQLRGLPLRLRLITAYSTPQKLEYSGSIPNGKEIADRLRAGHLLDNNASSLAKER